MNYLLKILENVKNGVTAPELAEKQVLDLLGVRSRFNDEQLKRVQQMLKSCAEDAYRAGFAYVYNDEDGMLTVEGFDVWWDNRNKVNLNGC